MTHILSEFTPITNGDINDIVQFVISSNLGTVYYDNLYLHKNTTLGVEDHILAQLKTYPNPTKGNWTIKTADIEMQSIRVYDALGKTVLSLNPNSRETTIDASSLRSGLYFAQIKTTSGLASIKLIKN